MGRNALSKVDWTLPGMEKFSEDDIRFFKRELEDEEGGIVYSIQCLGWGFWPISNRGYLDEHLLRKIADFIEIQNKPFWDDYEKYCQETMDENDFVDEEYSLAELEAIGSTWAETH